MASAGPREIMGQPLVGMGQALENFPVELLGQKSDSSQELELEWELH